MPGLVAAYNFDEGSGTTLLDLTANANNGAISGATWALGLNDGALSFDGQDDWVTIADDDSLDLTTAMTLEAWVHLSGRQGWQTAIFKEDDSAALAYGLYATDQDEHSKAVGSSGSLIELSSGVRTPLNRWVHLATTFDGSEFKIYVDGILRNSTPTTDAMPIGSDPLRLGGNSVWGEWLNGSIDDVRVYDRSLSASAIQADMDTPVASVPFDETPPTVSITSPSNGATVSKLVNLTADAADNGMLVGVRFLVDGISIGEQDKSAPFTQTWNSWPIENGTHTVTARATDAAGNSTESTISVQVSNGNALVAAYNFDEGTGTVATDVSGNGNDGELIYDLWSAAGKHGGASAFDGSQWITVPASASLDLTTAMTLEAWVRPAPTLATYACVLMKESDGGLSYALYASDTTGGGVETASPVTWITTDTELRWSAAGPALPPDEWTHLAATFDNETLSLYRNGVLVDALAVSGPIDMSTGPLRIGGAVPWGGERFEGLIDDVRIYSRALSATEIQADMNAAVAPSDCTGATLDDGNPCTLDACDPVAGITHTPVAPGTSCANETVCDGAETCNATGTCVTGTPPVIDDANPCTTDACDPIAGVSHTPVAAGTSCANHTICDGAETCDASGTCVAGTPPSVSDGNPCTTDTCDPVTGVTHLPVAAGTSCSDLDLCNGEETCSAMAVCVPGTPIPTEDGNLCTLGSCDPATGVVTHDPVPAGTECFPDICSTGECNAGGECLVVASLPPDDGDPCTVEWCDPVVGPQVKTCSAIDRSVGTTLHESMKWLIEEPNPVQVGVVPGTIEVKRAVALRGHVRTRDGSPLPGVTVQILNHPEFGYTLTRADGYFDLLVNGGGELAVDFTKESYLRTQRQVKTRWNEHVPVADVVMILPDPIATPIDLTASTEPFQVAQSSIQSDQHGDRQGTLLVPAGVAATMHLDNGATEELDSMTVRITEFTVGNNGPETMPGDLPVESRYTYAFEVNADEAIAANAPSVTFSTPLVYYVDNFLGFIAGTPVPVGSFNREAGAWVAEETGIVLDIVGESAGLAELDLTGDGVAEPASALAALGITDDERERLAELYYPGRTLWRVRIPHFTTPWDCNMAGGPPPDAEAPYGSEAEPGTGGSSGSAGAGGSAGMAGSAGSAGSSGSGGTSGASGSGGTSGESSSGGSSGSAGAGGSAGSDGSGGSGGSGAFSGSGGANNEDGEPYNEDRDGGGCSSEVHNASTIECEAQVLRESIPVAGTPYTLNYSSARVPGYRPSYNVRIPVSKANVPASLERIDVDVSVAGQRHHLELPPLPNQATTFTWDGRDAFGRELQGSHPATISIKYVYPLTYTTSNRFGAAGNGVPITVDTEPPPPGLFIERCAGTSCARVPAPGRTMVSLAAEWTVPVGSMDLRSAGALGGWTLDAHHVLGLATKTLTLGDGRRLQRDSLPKSMKQMTQDSLPAGPFVVAPDGSILTGNGPRIYKLVGKQAPTPFAGNGTTTAYAGENLPATDPAVGLDSSDIAIGPDVSVYLADRTNHIVRRVSSDGIISTYAGIPTVRQLMAMDGPAETTALDAPRFLAVAPDGSVFVSTRYNIMKITTDRQLVRIAGRQETDSTVKAQSPPPDGEPATTVLIEPRGLAVSPDGTLYAILSGLHNGVANSGGSVIVKFVDGIMSIVVGTGCTNDCEPVWADGDIAIGAHVNPTSITFDGAGTLIFSDRAGTTSGPFNRVAARDPDGRLYSLAGIRGIIATLVGDGAPATNSLLSFSSSTDRSVLAGPNGLYVKSSIRRPSGTTGGSAILVRTTNLPDNLGESSVVPAQGEEALYTFDVRGRHVSTIHALTTAPLEQFGYDSAGRLITITDASGNVTSIERDAAGDPLAIIGPFGQRTELALDANGYLEQVTDPLGRTHAMTYSNGLLTSFTNPRGLTSTMDYDDVGRLEVDVDPASGSHTLSRTEGSSTWSVSDVTALGRTTTYETIDGEEVLTKTITHPDGTESIVTSGSNGVVTTSHPDGTLTTVSAVPEGRLGLNGALTSTTTVLPSGLTSVRTARRLYQGTDPEDLLAFTEYTDETTVNGRKWQTRFTRNDRTFVQSSPRGRDVTRVIDPWGRTVQTQIEGLSPITFTYDTQGRLATTQQGSRLSTNTYAGSGNAAGYLATFTDPLGIGTSFTRDAFGRPLTETRDATTTTFTWDAAGNLESVVPPGKPVHSLTYTPVNLLESYEPPASGLAQPNTTYDYDLDRMLRTETRPTGQQIVRTPDSAGRLDTVAIPGGVIDYEYYPAAPASGAGKVSDIFGPYGVDLAFTYDGFLTTSTEWSGDVTGAVAWQYDTDFQKILESVTGATGTSTIAFGYDNDQLLTCASPTTCTPASSDALTLSRSLQHGLVTGITLGNTSETLTYNTFGELASQNARYSGTSFANLTYHVEGSATAARDALGRIRQKTEVVGGTTKVHDYVYDDLGRLTDVTIDGVLNEHFGYDANGNRTTHFNAATGLTLTVSGRIDIASDSKTELVEISEEVRAVVAIRDRSGRNTSGLEEGHKRPTPS